MKVLVACEFSGIVRDAFAALLEWYVADGGLGGACRFFIRSVKDVGIPALLLARLGLATAPSRKVRPPRIAASPVHLECRLHQEIPLGRANGTSLIVGEVVHLAADDAVLDARGNVDPSKLVLVARMGGAEYVDTERIFTMRRPTPDDLMRGKPQG